MSKKELKLKGVLEKEAVVSCLEDFISAIKQGVVTFESKEESISVNPGPDIELEIKVKSKKEKQSIEFDLCWPLGEELKLKSLEMKISSREMTEEERPDAISENPEPAEKSKTPASSAPTIVAAHDENNNS